jgi:small subunit ribosomal protein S8
MSMTDPLADMFTRIRNGSKAKFEKVDIPSSKLKREIARILKEEGFIKNFRMVTSDQPREMIRIFLKYDSGRKGVIRIRRVSRPGRRVYVRTDKIPSTPRGVLTDKASREAHVGGEVLCSIW